MTEHEAFLGLYVKEKVDNKSSFFSKSVSHKLYED